MTDDIKKGKCEGCIQIVYDVNNMTEELKTKMREYEIKAVPTTVIDNEIKVVGIPNFAWVCSEDVYGKLKREYPLWQR